MDAAQVNAACARAHDLLFAMPAVQSFHQIGSSRYLPEPNDVDFAVLLNVDAGMNAAAFCKMMVGLNTGWEACSLFEYYSDDSCWGAIRSGDLNLMVTHDQGFYERYVLAMKVSHGLRLATRFERIVACKIVRDGMEPEMARQVAEHEEKARAEAESGEDEL